MLTEYMNVTANIYEIPFCCCMPFMLYTVFDCLAMDVSLGIHVTLLSDLGRWDFGRRIGRRCSMLVSGSCPGSIWRYTHWCEGVKKHVAYYWRPEG